MYKSCLSVAYPAADLSSREAISAIVSLRSLSLADLLVGRTVGRKCF
jgi:hypothetical protein